MDGLQGQRVFGHRPMEHHPNTKFYCPTCRQFVEVSKAMCRKCGSLIACTAVSHDQSRPFHGCGDNGILTDEILKLAREKNNLLMSLVRVVQFEIAPEVIHDFRVERIIQDIKQIA